MESVGSQGVPQVTFSEIFHVGIVVPQLEAGRARVSDILKTEWGPIVEYDTESQYGDGSHTSVPLRLCYSTSEPHIELIQEQVGTTWVCNEFSNLHHIGVFTEDLSNDSKNLQLAGCPLEICGRDQGGAPSTFTYHRDPLGIRIECVDIKSRSSMEAYLFKPG
jgi:hypothetical protein